METKSPLPQKTITYEWLKIAALLPTIAGLMFLSKALSEQIPQEYKEKVLSLYQHPSTLAYGKVVAGILVGLLLWNGKTLWYWLKALWKPILCFIIAVPLLLFHWAIPSDSWTKDVPIFGVIFSLSLCLFWRQLKIVNESRQDADAALTDPSTDLLGRKLFAENLFEMIKSQSMAHTPMRIAITGEWGSGKTTCLNFVKSFANAEKYPTAFFDSWQYKNTEEAKTGFIKAIDLGIGEWKGNKIGPFKRKTALDKFISAVGKSGRAAINNPSVGALFDDLFQSRLTGSLNVTKDYVSNILAHELHDKPLIIFIDDLDRSNDQIVFDFFLFIKEIVDVRNCIFICGFDIDAVENIFKKSSPVNDGKLFLEKIFHYIIPLPVPNPIHQSKLLDQQIASFKDNLKADIVLKHKNLLPTIPRKLKNYLRHISTLQSVFLRRFSDEDLNWERVYLFELLKIQFPTIAEQLYDDPELMVRNSVYQWLNAIEGQSTPQNNDSWEEKFESINSPRERQQAKQIIEAIEHCGSADSQKIRYELRALSYPAILTWAEYRDWYQEFKVWQESISEENKVWPKLVNEAEPLEARREFLRLLMREAEKHRGDMYTKMFEAGTNAKKELLLERLNDGILIASMHDLFGKEDAIFDPDITEAWVTMLRVPNGLNNTEHQDVFKLQEELLLQIVKLTKAHAGLLFDRLLANDDMRNKDYSEINERIAEIWRGELSSQILMKFRNPHGFQSYFNRSKHREEKKLLFFAKKSFDYSELRKLANEASDNEVVQENFIDLISCFFAEMKSQGYLLLQSSRTGNHKEFLGIAWRGATAKPLNRNFKVNTFLLERNEHVGKIKDDEGLLPIPDWMNPSPSGEI